MIQTCRRILNSLPWRTGLTVLSVFIASGFCFAGDERLQLSLTKAPEFRVSGDLLQPSKQIRRAFYREHFLPSVSRQLAPMSAVDLGRSTSHPSETRIVFDQMTQLAQRRVERAVGRAFRNFLHTETKLGRRVSGWEQRGESAKARQKADTWHFSGSFSHGVPEVELTQDLTPTSELSFTLDGEAVIGVDYRAGHFNRQSLHLDIDADRERYALGCRLSF